MKTTVNLDDDVAAALANEAKRSGIPVAQLANDGLRAKFCSKQPKPGKGFVVKPFSSGYQPGIDPTRLKDYLHEEDDERFRRLSQQPFK